MFHKLLFLDVLRSTYLEPTEVIYGGGWLSTRLVESAKYTVY